MQQGLFGIICIFRHLTFSSAIIIDLESSHHYLFPASLQNSPIYLPAFLIQIFYSVFLTSSLSNTLQCFPIIFSRHPNVLSWPALYLVPVYLALPSSTLFYSLCMDLREFSLCSLSTGRVRSLIFTQLAPSPDSGLSKAFFSQRGHAIIFPDSVSP